MFYIEKISLQNFKNYDDFSSEFTQGVNCIIGKNGIGKTNLLDAIYYLAFTKSAFNSVDSQLIKTNADHFLIAGTFKNDDSKEFISTRLVAGKKKEFLRNKIPIKKVSEYVGHNTMVLITPYDTDLIRDSSSARRKFFDGLISQISNNYLEVLLKYNGLIKHRNALLKENIKFGNLDLALLNVITDQIVPLAKIINTKRNGILADFNTECQNEYVNLSTGSETIEINYSSSIDEKEILKGYQDSFEKDKILGRTNYGPHKDDFEFLMKGISINKFASQGQQKSFIIALKIAQFNLIEQEKGFKPILMLDDFFDRIDNERIDNFTKLLKAKKFGQVFITDSHPERVKELFGKQKVNYLTLEN